MNADSETPRRRSGAARWVAAGFVAAFAVSVLTVIYTGLMVEGSRAEFDAGFRSVELAPGERRAVEFFFESDAAHADAVLELSFPAFVEPLPPGGGSPWRRDLDLDKGRTAVTVELRAVAAGSGYVVARAIADEPVGRDSVFVTVADD